MSVHRKLLVLMCMNSIALAGCLAKPQPHRYCGGGMIEEDGGYFYERDGGYFHERDGGYFNERDGGYYHERDGGYFHERDGEYVYERDRVSYPLVCRTGVRCVERDKVNAAATINRCET